MIYITGDTHGDKIRFLQLAKHGENGWDKDDILIICGDFGYIFADDEREHDFLDELAKKASSAYWLFDGVHPTAMGHELIKREWIKAFELIK